MAIDTHILDLLMGNEWDPNIQPFCLHCGYDLTGSVSDRCPECGMAFSHREVVREAYALKTKIRQLMTIDHWIKAGFYVGIAGAVPVLAFVLFKLAGAGGALELFSRIIGVMCGVPSICMGLSVLRILQLPPWAREKLAERISLPKAYLAATLGLVQIAISLFF